MKHLRKIIFKFDLQFLRGAMGDTNPKMQILTISRAVNVATLQTKPQMHNNSSWQTFMEAFVILFQLV